MEEYRRELEGTNIDTGSCREFEGAIYWWMDMNMYGPMGYHDNPNTQRSEIQRPREVINWWREVAARCERRCGTKLNLANPMRKCASARREKDHEPLLATSLSLLKESCERVRSPLQTCIEKEWESDDHDWPCQELEQTVYWWEDMNTYGPEGSQEHSEIPRARDYRNWWREVSRRCEKKCNTDLDFGDSYTTCLQMRREKDNVPLPPAHEVTLKESCGRAREVMDRCIAKEYKNTEDWDRPCMEFENSLYEWQDMNILGPRDHGTESEIPPCQGGSFL